MVAAPDRGPQSGGLALDTRAVPEGPAVRARPLAARHLGERARQRAVARGEERRRAARVLADIEAATRHQSVPASVSSAQMGMGGEEREEKGEEGDYALDRRAVLVVRVAARLAAPLLVALNGAQVGHFYDDSLERAREGGRERVLVRRHCEAAPARVAGPESGCGPERELADRGGVPTRGDTACCVDRRVSMRRGEEVGM